MLATAVAEPFDSPDYWFEVKWDGIRCLAFVQHDCTRLQSRNLRDISARYPGMTGLNRFFRGRGQAILDGELVGFLDGRPSFHAAVRAGGATVMVAFDLLHLDGEDLLSAPLEARREALQKAFACEEELVCTPPATLAGKAFYSAAIAQGLEGMVAKRLGTPYRPGVRSRDWLKIAHRRAVDCVICGLTAGAVPVTFGASVVRFGSFALGVFAGPGRLVYAGNVGTGWDSRGLRELVGLLRPCPAAPWAARDGPPRRIARSTTWVCPEVVVEIAYKEVTPERILRHPSLLRVRPDRDPETCGALPEPVTYLGEGDTDGRSTQPARHDPGA